MTITPPTNPDPNCQGMIYIGYHPEMDTHEYLPFVERARHVLGGESFGSEQDPLHGNRTDVTLNDYNGDGVTNTNTPGLAPENITYTINGQDRSALIDSSFTVRNTQVTFLNPDGSTETVTTTVRVMQDTNKSTFIMPPPSNAPQGEIDLMTSRPILSVEFSNNPLDYSPNNLAVFTDRTCFPCFAYGTMIETEYGSMPIQDLREGMKVWTVDNGMQPIRWIGSRKLSRAVLEGAPNLRPVRISAGALGKDTPSRDLLVSPQHRVLVRSRIAQKLFGQEEVLVAAKQLVLVDGIDIATDLPEVEYFHMLFDRHEIVLSDGAETESLYTGPEALESLGTEAREEIFTIFPELRDRPVDELPAGARLLASGRLGRKLAVRHTKNQRALVQ